MTEWKTIDSAPRDGTIVLLFCPNGIERLYTSPGSAKHLCLGYYGGNGSYFDHEGWWSVESREEIWGYGGELTGPMSETENLKAEPTHWAELPTPLQPN